MTLTSSPPHFPSQPWKPTHSLALRLGLSTIQMAIQALRYCPAMLCRSLAMWKTIPGLHWIVSTLILTMVSSLLSSTNRWTSPALIWPSSHSRVTEVVRAQHTPLSVVFPLSDSAQQSIWACSWVTSMPSRLFLVLPLCVATPTSVLPQPPSRTWMTTTLFLDQWAMLF